MDDTQAEAAHREEAHQQLSPIGRKLFKYVEFDENEVLIAEIRKHPIGIFFISAGGIFIGLTVLIGTLFLGANFDSYASGVTENTGSAGAIIIGIGLLLSLLIIGVTAISIVLYIRNVVFVTNEKIAEVSYVSLFNRRVLQLNIGKVEDVTIFQKGILSHLFEYGSMLIETAGETPNPSFTLVPRPSYFSKKIIEAHEKYVEKYGN